MNGAGIQLIVTDLACTWDDFIAGLDGLSGAPEIIDQKIHTEENSEDSSFDIAKTPLVQRGVISTCFYCNQHKHTLHF